MSTQFRRYDIIINGGGIVGFTLLNLILKSPQLSRFKVLLIEQASEPRNFDQPPRQNQELSNHEWQTEADCDSSSSQNQFSNRVSSITVSSKKTFEKLGVWTSVEPYAKRVNSIRVWNYNYSHKILFKQNESNFKLANEDRDTVFSVVENNRLSLALLNNICKTNKADETLLWNHTLEHLGHAPDEGLVKLIAKGTGTGEDIALCAPLILGCDGFKSKVREFSRMKYNEFSLDKTALVGTVKVNFNQNCQGGGTNDIAYQRFSASKDTVAALLPLDNYYSSFVLSAPNEYAKQLLDLPEEEFISEFNLLLNQNESPHDVLLTGLHNFTNSMYDGLHQVLDFASFYVGNGDVGFSKHDDGNLGEPPTLHSVVEGSRATFPLIFGSTTPKMISALPGRCDPQIALLGDSSHRVHPLAGQGLNLGIQDTVVLVNKLESMIKCGERVFDENDLTILSSALKKYECERQSYIIPMSAGILSMTKLFKLMPTSMLTSINKCNFIKTASVRFANGC